MPALELHFYAMDGVIGVTGEISENRGRAIKMHSVSVLGEVEMQSDPFTQYGQWLATGQHRFDGPSSQSNKQTGILKT